MRKKSLYEFINQANKKHNYKYNYEFVILPNLREKIEIICPIHGNFYQIANEHLKGYGCQKCGGTAPKSIDNFIIQANILHCNKYNYSKVHFKNLRNIIIIICPIHGEFLQSAKLHLRGAGCQLCNGGVPFNTQNFVKRAQEIHHGKYDYSKSIYKNSKTKLEIICKIHGTFLQSPNDHFNGSNCPKCTRLGRTSKIEHKWLDSLDIPIEYRNFQIKINNKFFYVDGFNPTTNTVYEFYGDFWHGNPNIYKPNDINYINKKTYKQLYDATLDRQYLITQAGYNVVYMWENDYKGK